VHVQRAARTARVVGEGDRDFRTFNSRRSAISPASRASRTGVAGPHRGTWRRTSSRRSEHARERERRHSALLAASGHPRGRGGRRWPGGSCRPSAAWRGCGRRRRTGL